MAVRNRRAALALAVLAPLCAEVSLGTVPLRMAWAWLIFAPMYSAGALFLREIVRRTGGGYGNLLLLGLAYGLVEEGLALQSLTSPHLYGSAGWAPRLFGVNSAYTEINLVYHAVFSVTIPVIVVEYLFGRHGSAPYLRRGGVITAGVITLLGAALLRAAVPPSEDPGYTMPPYAMVIVALLTVAVVLLALRVRLRPARNWAPPSIPVVAVTAAVAAFGFLAMIWPFGGATQPLFTHGNWALLPMTGAAVIVAGALYAAWAFAWTVEHLVAASFGALVGHTLFGLVSNAQTLTDRLFLALVAILTASLGAATLSRPLDIDIRGYARRVLIAFRGGRPLITVTDGAAYLRLLALSGVATVLIVRAFLALAGYPQVGGASLHIAHVLWGGLLMLAGLLCALLFAGGGARAATAVLGGVGLGLFVDEVGKFITRRNDYFYRPAAAIIYLVFAALLVFAAQLRRRPAAEDRHRLATAAQLASAGVTSGLTSRQRHAAEELLAGQQGEAAEAVRGLLSAAPHREHSQRAQAMVDRAEAITRRLLDGRWFTPAVLGLFIVSRVVVAVVFVSQALVLVTGHHLSSGAEPGAIAGGAVARSVALACVVAGLLRWRADKRSAYGWFRVAVLVDLLVSQIFNFTDSQFAAVGELPFNVLVLAVVSYHLRRSGT